MEPRKVFRRFDDSLRSWRERLERFTDEQFEARPAPRVWTPGQVYHHVATVTDLLVGEALACARGEGERRWGLLPTLFCWWGSFPPVRIRLKDVPDEFSGAVDPVQIDRVRAALELTRMEETMRSALDSVEQAPRGIRRRHFAVGWFDAPQWYQLAEMHLRHHERQMRRIEKAVGR